MHQLEDLKGKANGIRKNTVKTITETKPGHLGGSLSSVEIATAIYLTQMDITPDNVASTSRGRSALPKDHASSLLYSVLAGKGLIEKEELLTFRKVNSRLQGHPSTCKLPGADMPTGLLGQGISCAAGMALANKYNKEDHRIYTVLGDGERQEGQVWEAVMVASHYKLDNLLAFVSHNGLQIDGNVTDVMNSTPVDEKFKAFGWNVIVLKNGNDLESVIAACREAKTVKGKPTVVAVRTVKGKGVSFMENKAGWHGTAPSTERYAEAIAELKGGCKQWQRRLLVRRMKKHLPN